MKNKVRYGLAISVGVAVLVLGFNNCGHVNFGVPAEVLKEQQLTFQATSSLLINNGDQYTRDQQVQLSLNSPRALEMKISNQPDCSDGSWEPFSSAKIWTLSKANAQVSVYAEFKNISDDITDCISASIIHDNVPPKALFADPGGQITNASNVAINWVASDNLSGIASSTCIGSGSPSATCMNNYMSSPKTDGAVVMHLSLTDKAGNVAPDYVYTYLFDQTPPIVKINSQPASLTGSGAASFSFSAVDNLSGVKDYACSLDMSAFMPCTSPMAYSGLAAGNHSFRVTASDVAGNLSSPGTAQWMIDMTAPTLAFTQTPPPYANSTSGTFAFTGVKNGQPISIFECQLDGGAFASCTSPSTVNNLTEGNHTFNVRGTDSLGNVSAPISYTWLVDVTPPAVMITQGPGPFVNTSTVTFQYTATDMGSGIKTIECRLDSAAFVACTGASTLNNLAEGSHSFTVRATDQAGNQSMKSSTFAVDLTPPVVQILTGPANYVNTPIANFTFSATDSSGIALYECRIDSGSYSPCTSPYAASSVDEGGHVFYVRATDKAGNMSTPATWAWNLDLSPPIIQIVSAPAALKTTQHAVIQYKVIDLASGVASVQCGLTQPSGSVAACAVMNTVDLGTLPAGNYGFTIAAVDNVGNSFQSVVNFQVTTVPVVCDPFTQGSDAICDGGLVGNIYYLDSDGQNKFKGLSTKTVDYFITQGIKENVILNLKQLFVSTRSFTAGFPTNDGSLVKDNTGNALTSYFAFDLNTAFKLDPANDLPGWYQFATLSDDGSVVNITPQGSTAPQSLVANDGDHSTAMGCSKNAIWIDDTTRMKMEIKYYQGPPTEIALVMMWRRVNGPTDPLDASCGVAGNGAFFGPAPYSNFTSGGYANLLTRGWKVAAPANFIAPPP